MAKTPGPAAAKSKLLQKVQSYKWELGQKRRRETQKGVGSSWGAGVGGIGEDDGGPEGLERRLLEGEVRGRIVGAKERVPLLREHEADGREHGEARVLELDLAIEQDLLLGEAVLPKEAGRVEDACVAAGSVSRNDARHALGKLGSVEGSHLNGHGRAGGEAGEAGRGEGGDGKHDLCAHRHTHTYRR